MTIVNEYLYFKFHQKALHEKEKIIKFMKC